MRDFIDHSHSCLGLQVSRTDRLAVRDREDQVRDARLEVVQEAAHRRRAVLLVVFDELVAQKPGRLGLGAWCTAAASALNCGHRSSVTFVERFRVLCTKQRCPSDRGKHWCTAAIRPPVPARRD